jgi:hypothetical protein
MQRMGCPPQSPPSPRPPHPHSHTHTHIKRLAPPCAQATLAAGPSPTTATHPTTERTASTHAHSHPPGLYDVSSISPKESPTRANRTRSMPSNNRARCAAMAAAASSVKPSLSRPASAVRQPELRSLAASTSSVATARSSSAFFTRANALPQDILGLNSACASSSLESLPSGATLPSGV